MPSRRGIAATRTGGVCAALALYAAPAFAQRMSTSPEQAYDLGDIPSARALAMGGALDALGVSTTALYLNPANMSLARVYHIEALGAFSPESKRQTYGLAAVDSVLNSSHVAGGLVATWSELDPDGLHRTWTDVRAAASIPVGDFLALGISTRWLRVEQAPSVGPFGASPVSDGTPGSPIFSTLTFDAGATASVGDFRAALVGHNLTSSGNALAPTTASAGVGYATSVVALEVDGLLDFTTWTKTQGRLMAGGEVFVADRYAIRVGWQYDSGMNVHSPSFGLGYIDPKWSVELGIRRDLVTDHATLGVLSLRYFYDPTGSTTSAPDEPDAQ